MFMQTVMEYFDFLFDLHVMNLDLKARTKRRYLDINDGLYRTKQTFIVDLGFLGVHSDEDHQR
jgi:hypothetical protein